MSFSRRNVLITNRGNHVATNKELESSLLLLQNHLEIPEFLVQPIHCHERPQLAVPIPYLFTHLRHDHPEVHWKQPRQFNRQPGMHNQ